MEITAYHKMVYSAEICPYCGSITKVVSEDFIYGRSYSGKSVICCNNYPKCNSYVGCHKDGKPLGRLANKPLRLAKKEAHGYFDALWKTGLIKRSDCYKKLSDYLNVPIEFTHIGMFNKVTCIKVIKFSMQQLISR